MFLRLEFSVFVWSVLSFGIIFASESERDHHLSIEISSIKRVEFNEKLFLSMDGWMIAYIQYHRRMYGGLAGWVGRH